MSPPIVPPPWVQVVLHQGVRFAIPNGIDNAQRKLFRMESVQGQSIYGYFEQIENARDTYLNS